MTHHTIQYVHIIQQYSSMPILCKTLVRVANIYISVDVRRFAPMVMRLLHIGFLHIIPTNCGEPICWLVRRKPTHLAQTTAVNNSAKTERSKAVSALVRRVCMGLTPAIPALQDPSVFCPPQAEQHYQHEPAEQQHSNYCRCCV